MYRVLRPLENLGDARQYWEDGGSRPAQAKSLQDPISVNRSLALQHGPAIPTIGSINENTVVQAGLGHKARSI
jgi:hypothetical protein